MISHPERKRDAPSRATRYTTTHTTNDIVPGGDVQATFAVFCTKADGRRALFQTYCSRSEAEAVAEQLCRVGCACSIEGTP